MAPTRLHSLSSLRFFAASAWVIYHLLPGWVGVPYLNWPKLTLNLLSLAYLGLPFFYALSGFVLFYVYRLKMPLSRKQRQKFWGKRFARLAPAFYFSLLLGAWPFFLELIAAHGPWGGISRGIAYFGINLAFLSAWLPFSLDFNFPSWSISVEMFCYVLFPFLLPLVSRLSRLDAWKALVCCYLAGAAIQLVGVVAYPELISWPWELSHASQHLTNFLQLHPLVHFPEFAFGIFLGRLWVLRESERSGDASLATACLLLILVVNCGIRWPFLMITSFLFLPLEGLLLWGGAGRRGTLTLWLEWPFMVLLGESSYVIYALHVPLGYWWGRSFGLGRPYLSFGAYFLFLCALAVGLHIYFELPLRALIIRQLDRRFT